MNKKDNGLSSDELDKFWNIDDIVPKQKNKIQIHTPIGTVKIELSTEPTVKSEKKDAKTYFIPPYKPQKKPKVPDYEYDIENSLVHHVEIYSFSCSVDEYDRFLEDAIKYSDIHGHPCDEVEFFAYSPQYTQLTKRQLDWYLYWRDMVRSGEYIRTDSSYVLLYIYELINLGDRLNVKKSLITLLELWEKYSIYYKFLNRLCGEWICDFALIYKLNISEIIDAEKLVTLMPHCMMKELFFCADFNKNKKVADILLSYCSNYDYRKSKFAVGDNLPIYDKHIKESLSYAMRRLSPNGFLSSVGLEDNTIKRLAFIGVHSSSSIKRKILVSLSSFSNSHELRFMISDIVKYSENKIRALLGIKSRLTVISLSPEIRQCIDEYFKDFIPLKQIVAKKEETEQFDPNYDVIQVDISIEDALNIEKTSWETVDTLIETFAEKDEVVGDQVVEVEQVEPVFTELAQNTADENPFGKYTEFLNFVIAGNFAAQRDYALKHGKMLDTFADKINEIALDLWGDVLLYNEGDGYMILGDYMEEFLNVFK